MRIACFILLSLPILIFGQAPGCPNIQVDDETVDCNNPCVDLTATLAAPGVSVEDLVSVPALDFLGLNPIRPFATGKGRGVIPSATNWLITALASNDPYETREAYVKFLQSSVPTSLQPAVEQYYMGIPNPSNYFKFWDLTKEDKDIFKMVLWFNLLIGIYNIYLYVNGDWWFNLLIGALNIGAWVFNRQEIK